MSTLATHHGHAHGVVHAIAKAVSSVGVTVPASAKMRADLVDDYRRALGLDLSDDDRAAKVRSRHRS